jgi:hypothetical protein
MYKTTTEPIICLGKKTGCYRACFGEFTESGSTKQIAIDNLEKALNWYFKDLHECPKIAQSNKRVFIMERYFSGYTIGIIQPDRNYLTGGEMIVRMSRYQAENEFESYVMSCIEASEGETLNKPF